MKRTKLRLLRNFISSDRGAILPIAALFAFAILTYGFFAIETSLLQSAATQAKQYKRIFVLNAARAYFASRQRDINPCLDHQCAMNAAIEDAKESSLNNRLVSQKETPDVYWNQNPNNADARFIAGFWFKDEESCDATEAIISGNGGGSVTCGGADYPFFHEWPWAPNTALPDDLSPNAFQLRGDIYPAGFTLKLLGYLTGSSTIRLRSSVTASFTPRRIVIGADKSPSVTEETHLRWTFLGPFIETPAQNDPVARPNCCPFLYDANLPPQHGHGNRAAYITFEDNCRDNQGDDFCPTLYIYDPAVSSDGIAVNLTCNNTSAPNNGCMGNDDGKFDVEDYPMDLGWEMLNNTIVSYNVGGATRYMNDRSSNSPAPTTTLHHFGDDYVRRYVVGDSDYDNIQETDSEPGFPQFIRDLHPNPNNEPNYAAGDPYFVQYDYYRNVNPGQVYEGPQPLTRIILSVKEALEELKQTRVPGDEASVFFFDQGVDWRSHIRFDPNNLDYIIEFLNIDPFDDNAFFDSPTLGPGPLLPGSGAPDDPYNFNFPGRELGFGLDRLIRMGVFPDRRTFTNGLRAVQAAGEALVTARANAAATAAEHIILFSDFKVNCIPGGQCGGSFQSYDNAKDALLDYVTDVHTLQPGIPTPPAPIHIIQFGDVGAHTAAIVNPEALPPGRTTPFGQGDVRCLTDDDFRKNGLGDSYPSFVVPTDSPNQTPEQQWQAAANGLQPFYYATFPAWIIAATTGGLYGPVRPRDEAGCQALFDAHAGNPGVVTDPNDPSNTYLDPDVFDPICNGNSFINNAAFPTGSAVNASGANPPALTANNRILHDPYCRTPTEQIRQYLARVIGSNPFAIVDSR